jgi:hypothetical protein
MRLQDVTPEESYIINDAPCLTEASKCITESLDTKKEPANLKGIAAIGTNLDKEQREDLYTLPKKYESLFGYQPNPQRCSGM